MLLLLTGMLYLLCFRIASVLGQVRGGGVEAGGATQGGHQTPERERDRGEKSTGEQGENGETINYLLTLLSRRENSGKNGYIEICQYLFF